MQQIEIIAVVPSRVVVAHSTYLADHGTSAAGRRRCSVPLRAALRAAARSGPARQTAGARAMTGERGGERGSRAEPVQQGWGKKKVLVATGSTCSLPAQCRWLLYRNRSERNITNLFIWRSLISIINWCLSNGSGHYARTLVAGTLVLLSTFTTVS